MDFEITSALDLKSSMDRFIVNNLEPIIIYILI